MSTTLTMCVLAGHSHIHIGIHTQQQQWLFCACRWLVQAHSVDHMSVDCRWIGFRLDLISATTMLTAGLLSAGVRGRVTPALLGLALSHLLQMTGVMQWFVRQSAGACCG